MKNGWATIWAKRDVYKRQVEKTNDDKEKALEMTIEELDLSVRSFCLLYTSRCV